MSPAGTVRRRAGRARRAAAPTVLAVLRTALLTTARAAAACRRRPRPGGERLRIRFLLQYAQGGGGTIRTVLNLGGYLADHHDVEIVSVFRGRAVLPGRPRAAHSVPGRPARPAPGPAGEAGRAGAERPGPARGRLLPRQKGFDPLIEAMGKGLPVVAFDCPTGPAELVGEGDGLVVPPQDVPALGDALRTLMRDAALRDRMGEHPLATSRAYRLDRIGPLWLDLLRELARSRRS